MREMAEWADIPIINMQCDVDHPTQTLADLMTIREQRGENLHGLKIAVTWAFAPSYAKPLSVPQGLITLMPRFGMDVVLAHPPGYELMPEVIEKAKAAAAEAGGDDHVHRRHGRGVRGRRRRLPEVVGQARRVHATSRRRSPSPARTRTGSATRGA